ncbi:MAG: peptidoglycan-binding protein [Actinomycetota bacterium]|nr:peptidoglycan-binding protein [Actinomycetota bacterium]
MKVQEIFRLDDVDRGRPASPQERRRLRPLVAVAVAVAVVVTGTAFVLVGGDGGAEGDDESKASSTSLAAVTRRTLREQERVDGTLGYGMARPVVNPLQGTVTWLAPEGSTVKRGETLYRVDENPVVLLYGEVPAYRRMARGMDDGPDVAQLEANLKALGYADGLIDTPDNHFDAATEAAVKRWEHALGVTQDGAVELGEVVFRPGEQRVGTHQLAIGADARPGQDVMETTGRNRVVTVDLDARKQSVARVGEKVEIELPTGRVVSGTVADVGKVAKTSSGPGSGTGGAGGSGSGSGSNTKPTVAVTIAVDDQQASGDLEGAPVKVRITRSSKEGVLAVPVNALLALPDGGYGVEVDQNGARRIVKVETGLFSSGYVEVSGDGISEGLQVVVPS